MTFADLTLLSMFNVVPICCESHEATFGTFLNFGDFEFWLAKMTQSFPLSYHDQPHHTFNYICGARHSRQQAAVVESPLAAIMVLINGRKFACDACIRGHRASSCSHTGRQLLPVRPKGRPSSQCDTCKAKRATGSFHGKCHCSTTSESRSSSSRSISSAEDDGKADKVAVNGNKGKHSLETLMNPCRCKTTGICTCCKTGTSQENEGDQILDTESGAPCCDIQDCCSEQEARPTCSTSAQSMPTQTKSCCSNTLKATPLAPMPHLSAQPTLTYKEVDAIMSPDCHCGENCSCPGCLRKDGSTVRQSKENEECPEKCVTCSACVYGLTRPSGIDVIDEWMEKDNESRKHEANVEATTQAANKRPKTDSGQPQQTSQHPLLPPFANASSFFTSHFLDPDRRRHFAEQLQEARDGSQTEHFSDDRVPADEDTSFGHRLPGETDEDWQIRHGFYHLTPDAIRIFDSTRQFRDERELYISPL
jgi:hypothetical protein